MTIGTRARHGWLAAALTAAAAGCTMVGCGSSGTTPIGPGDGGSDATIDTSPPLSDSAAETAMPMDAPPDTVVTEAGPEAATDAPADAPEESSDGATPCTNGTACTLGNTNGVCIGGTCSQCDNGQTSTGSDSTCTTAYGGASATPYVCIAGSCAPGNCTANSACTAPTPTCGFSTPNVCGGCTADSQCPTGDICVTLTGSTQGTCVANTAGGCGLSSNVACPDNAADVCCTGVCFPGNCCIPAVTNVCGASETCVADQSGETVGGGICSACAPVTGADPVYHVDPVNGSDVSGTGNNTAFPACAFKTITRALQVIGASPPVGTSINVIGSSGGVTVTGVATGSPPAGEELFPIKLPGNVTLTTSVGAVTVKVPAPSGAVAQTTGFVLSGNPSAIVGGTGAAFVIDGQTQTATTGIVIQSAGATLGALTTQNFAGAGIAVANAGATASLVTINAGVLSTGNGTDGLFVNGSSTATITGTLAAPTQFNNNGAHGIRVITNGAITVNGSVGATPPSTSTVITSGNAAAGVWIEQTANSTANNAITGIVCTTSTAGNGIRIVPGSNVTLRSSWLLGNSSGNGVDIENIQGGTNASVTNIDLGSAANGNGGNVFQAPTGGSVNGGAGICLKLPGASVTFAELNALGNVFGGTGSTAVNCASTAATLRTAAALACANHADVGGTIVAFPADAGAGNTINVTMCSY
jgi:hypothetical protein